MWPSLNGNFPYTSLKDSLLLHSAAVAAALSWARTRSLLLLSSSIMPKRHLLFIIRTQERESEREHYHKRTITDEGRKGGRPYRLESGEALLLNSISSHDIPGPSEERAKELDQATIEGLPGGVVFLSQNNTVVKGHSGSTVILPCRVQKDSQFGMVKACTRNMLTFRICNRQEAAGAYKNAFLWIPANPVRFPCGGGSLVRVQGTCVVGLKVERTCFSRRDCRVCDALSSSSFSFLFLRSKKKREVHQLSKLHLVGI